MDEGQEFIGGLGIALLNRFDHARDLAHGAAYTLGRVFRKAQKPRGVVFPWLGDGFLSFESFGSLGGRLRVASPGAFPHA